MLSPALAASTRCESPADLMRLPLLPHDQWLHWFRRVGVNARNLRFCPDDYSTYELDAAAAIEGAGVALLSPTLFASLLQEGKLIQPFAAVMQGPGWHFLLLKPGEARASVHDFRCWVQDEIVKTAEILG
jgi:LysR family glycine cleavage system transcriptional activator